MKYDKADKELDDCQYYDDIEAIYANIETLRKIKGVTQQQLANAVGISRSAYQKYVNGCYYSMKIITLYQIANYLGVSIEELI